MCAECGMNPCHPRCPNAPEPVPIYECVKCGYGILAGDKFWDSPEGKICEEYGYGSGKGIKAEDRTGKKGYGMGLAYRKIPGYHIIFNRRKIRRTVRGSVSKV